MQTKNPFDLSGKTALVTGCNRGIGKAMALALASAGADIIGVSANLALTGSAVETEVNQLGRQFKAYQCDFGNRQSLEEFTTKVLAENAVIDILVNNAGTIMRMPASEHPNDYWDTVLNVNLDAPFILTREIGRHMIDKQGFGKIIFTASLLSFQGGINVPGYAASKGAIASLTKAFANEWAPKGINVNAIAPGYISTDNTAALEADAERSKSILARIPAARWGQASDLGGATVFLSSAASDYINGIILPVDGGWLGR